MLFMYNIGIMNFHFSNDNYGALMVSYTMQHALKKESISSEIINYIPSKKYISNTVFEYFRDKYLTISNVRMETLESLRNNIDNYKAIIVGSDQVFRGHPYSPYFLSWIYGNINCISYAASFGSDRYNASVGTKKYTKEFLNRFDAHSVRESSGVHIMKNTFGLDAIQVLDPTLLLDPKDYQPIIDSEPCAQP